ncbi:MAG TPA: OsmC family protein [Candidatus Limnocylindria bacterium]|jgi:uncharacterized OsmC-like protein
MATTAATTRNGINVDQLVGTIEAIKKDPSLAAFTFRAHTDWQGGGRVRTRIRGFSGAGQEDASRTDDLIIAGDEPPVLLGTNSAPNAVEAVLHALASCLAIGFVYNAAARGITVKSLGFDVDGTLDLHAFLGLSDTVRPGYSGIRVTYRVEADAPRQALEDLCEYVQRTSPVLDIVRNPVPVTVTLAA